MQAGLAGLEAARRRGRRGGRPVVIGAEKLGVAIAQLEAGASKSAVCRILAVSRSTLNDTLSLSGLDGAWMRSLCGDRKGSPLVSGGFADRPQEALTSRLRWLLPHTFRQPAEIAGPIHSPVAQFCVDFRRQGFQTAHSRRVCSTCFSVSILSCSAIRCLRSSAWRSRSAALRTSFLVIALIIAFGALGVFTFPDLLSFAFALGCWCGVIASAGQSFPQPTSSVKNLVL